MLQILDGHLRERIRRESVRRGTLVGGGGIEREVGRGESEAGGGPKAGGSGCVGGGGGSARSPACQAGGGGGGL